MQTQYDPYPPANALLSSLRVSTVPHSESFHNFPARDLLPALYQNASTHLYKAQMQMFHPDIL